jgi:membrane-associated protease RseP (regulator of RpoE activity)
MGNLVLPGSLGDELVRLHPVAFAGWLGLFITMLNLLPFGQLDGGHILYGLLGRRQGRVGRGFLLLLLPLGFLWWGWWFWAVAAVLLSRGRMTHPDVLQHWEGLGPRRRLVALGAILIFFLCFSPVPIGF